MNNPNPSLLDMIRKLESVLLNCKDPVIAVSGGVDSMTLSSFAHKFLRKGGVRMVHALSPAVPKAATLRVRELAKYEGWAFECVDAGEFANINYRANPINRCFFCKTHLYQSLVNLSDGTILSGTNVDDLSDFRPGLEAAANAGVRHPYVEAGYKKSDLRRLAWHLGLDSLATLPASPCLSSRVETGIAIQESDLKAIDLLETFIRKKFSPQIIRCRIRSTGLVIELNKGALEALSLEEKNQLIDEAIVKFPNYEKDKVQIMEYQKGSAFLTNNMPAFNV